MLLAPRSRDLDGPHRPAAVRILTPGGHPLRTHATLCAPALGEQDTYLVVAQFEEVFILCHDPIERAGFLARLPAAAPGSRLRVVLGVRVDFLRTLRRAPRARRRPTRSPTCWWGR
ncbi:nSTAND1 domain-containing NTPase [Streptomyces tauricus]|uniref:nSTAND1 domain-containing NTPase n=1 Tax=Streptomyces tauricus TaxID=68274 RepID=UPI0038B6B1F6